VFLPPMVVPVAGEVEPVALTVRNGRFEAVSDASVTLTVTDPDGAERTLDVPLQDPSGGKYGLPLRFERPGVYRLATEAHRGELTLGTATRHVLVGGTDLEMADLSLNEPVLQRLAQATGGRYLRADEASGLRDLLREDEAAPTLEMKDLWHNGWTLAAIIGLLAAEWLTRRQFGLA
jgi:hypothetical protein